MSRRALRLFVLPAACATIVGLVFWADAHGGSPGFSVRKARLSAAGRLKAVSRGAEEPASDMLDPAYSRYVDLRSIGEALLDGDAAGLTDAALALAEGERVLLRPHNSLTVAEVASAATRLAAEQKDAESLKRLSALAEQRGDKELLASIKTAEKLAAGSRMPAPEMTISVDEVTPEQFAQIRALVGDAKLARTLGSARSIDSWTPERLGNLPGPLQGQMQKLIADTREALPEQGATDSQLTALEKLAAAARGDEETIMDSDSSADVTGGF